MKNFLELLDTNPQLSVDVKLKIHGNVNYIAEINQHRLSLDNTFKLALTDNIDFVIDLKDFTEGTSGIEIVNFSIDGYEILPLYRHLANPPTHYIDQLGKWQLTIPAPFYTWYHCISGQGWLLNPVA